MTGAAQAMFDDDEASRALGMQLIEAADGRATVSMRVTPAMVNGHDMAHGGFLFLLADTAFACACNSHGPVTVAASAEIDFITPVRADEQLLAVATERTRFGRSGIYDVTVFRDVDGERTVVAEFRGRSRTIGEARSS
jgi:acyl-CoA thioesterase